MKTSFVIAFLMAAVASASAVAMSDNTVRGFVSTTHMLPGLTVADVAVAQIEVRCHCDGHCCAGSWCSDEGTGPCCDGVPC